MVKIKYNDKIKCLGCGAPWDGISTHYYDGKEHEIPKAICYKCGKLY